MRQDQKTFTPESQVMQFSVTRGREHRPASYIRCAESPATMQGFLVTPYHLHRVVALAGDVRALVMALMRGVYQ